MNESPVEIDGALVASVAVDPDGPAPGHVRLRLDLSYEGTDLAGWQRQGPLRTGQVLLEEALKTVLRLPNVPATFCAGRTDAGVHARGQVVHVDVPIDAWQSVESVAYRMRAILPSDVVIHSAVEAPPGFDARFSVLRRRYVYRVSDRRGADPMTRRFVLDHGYALDVDAMNRASEPLLGLHDFTAYCRSHPHRSSLRTLLEFNWHRDPSEDHLVLATVSADAFCHSMVRSLVGALLPVGDGRQPESFPKDVLEARQRTALVSVVSAHGLTFEEVLYVPDDQLGEQATRTKRRRTMQDLQDAQSTQSELNAQEGTSWPASTSST